MFIRSTFYVMKIICFLFLIIETKFILFKYWVYCIHQKLLCFFKHMLNFITKIYPK